MKKKILAVALTFAVCLTVLASCRPAQDPLPKGNYSVTETGAPEGYTIEQRDNAG